MISVKENYIVDRKGNTTNVIIQKKEYDKMLEYIEELEDVAAYDMAKAEKSKNIPWEKVKR
jgi:antitoxin Phd